MPKKKCPRCERTLGLSNYATRRNGQPASYCRDCQREVSRQHYVDNREECNRKRLERQRKQRKKLKELRDEMKRVPCTLCGEEHPSWAMDFDHRDPTLKDFSIGQASSVGWSKTRFLEEIKKCDVVCALCHRYLTHGTADQVKSRRKAA